jgi:5-methylcytosine-specific restriction endonuclease McrBC regulatory subunit McrC
MTGDCHVQFCERLEGKFLGSTLLWLEGLINRLIKQAIRIMKVNSRVTLTSEIIEAARSCVNVNAKVHQ